MRKYKLAKGMNENSNVIANVEATWPKIVEIFSRHEQDATKLGKYIVGGYFKSTHREESQMVARTLLTLDLDSYSGSLLDLEMELRMGIDCAFIAYSTFRHSPDAPRIRIIVPMSREVTPSEYREVSRQFTSNLGFDFDSCSFVPNQAMFYPKCPDIEKAWHASQEGQPYSVPDLVHSVIVQDDSDDDLAIAVASQPLDLTNHDMVTYLQTFVAQGKEYDDWFMVGAAIKHQTQGSEQGFQMWLEWSAKSEKHDPAQMRKKWNSINNKRAKPITFASIIARVRDMATLAVAAPEDHLEFFEALSVKAAEVSSMEAYNALKAEIQSIPETILARDERAMLAAEILEGFGRDNGLTKQEIKRELMATQQKKRRIGGKTDAPSWVQDWVYLEIPCEFANTRMNYSIKREAFNAKHGREPEVMMAEIPASEIALHSYQIPVLVDSIYWPGEGSTLTDQHGRAMLNTYHASGIAPCEAMDADGEAVVGRFIKHLSILLGDKAEQEILLDFMTHTIKCPGDKINWSILLHGPEGVGKSYISVIMELILGQNFKSLSPSAISGRFTAWGTGSVLNVIEEIHVSGESRYEIMDKLKPFISNETIQIEEKGRDPRTVPNFSNYMMFTNRKDAVPVSDGDRRYCVMETAILSEEHLFDIMGGKEKAESYFSELFDETRRRIDAIHRFFLDRSVGVNFNAKGRAPMTAAKMRMIELSRSPDRLAIEDAIGQHRCAIIDNHILDVTWLNRLVGMEAGEPLPQARITSKVLLDMGYVPITGKRLKIAKTQALHYVWLKAGGDEVNAKQIVRNFHEGSLDDDLPPF